MKNRFISLFVIMSAIALQGADDSCSEAKDSDSIINRLGNFFSEIADALSIKSEDALPDESVGPYVLNEILADLQDEFKDHALVTEADLAQAILSQEAIYVALRLEKIKESLQKIHSSKKISDYTKNNLESGWKALQFVVHWSFQSQAKMNANIRTGAQATGSHETAVAYCHMSKHLSGIEEDIAKIPGDRYL